MNHRNINLIDEPCKMSMPLFNLQPQAQPDAPPRNSRQQASASNKPNSQPASSANHHQPQIVNPLDPIESSDTDSEPEETNERGRNDGTLLASDPPKPL